VKLSGSAPSAEAKSRAEQIARTVSGVDSVDNRLTVTN
jgi:osmotically-inducible protein OsmY